ncbi:MAG: copper oxidase [Chlamydiales bacterium]
MQKTTLMFLVIFLMRIVLLNAEEQHTSPTLSPPQPSDPPRPWAELAENPLPLSEPFKDYTPVKVPNGTKLPYKVVDGVKVFHLIAEPIQWEIAKGLTINAWAFNGSVPGPVLEMAKGDRVRIYVTNSLPAPTTVHWHGFRIPCGMDGVAGLTQPAIPPGETYTYEFICPDSATYMYHTHFDSMTQEGMGLIGMIIVHEREEDLKKRPDRDYVILLHEMAIPVDTATPDTVESGGFNILTMNGKVMPDTEPLVAQIGDRVWIRFGNLSAMDHHPIHLHGYAFHIIGSDGGWLPKDTHTLPETTVLVPVGATRVISFLADNPGDWIFHCHMTHHIMNQMGHKFPNMIGMNTKGFDEKVRKLIPGYMTMGTTGMRDMTKSGMPIPPNSIPMLGFTGQFGSTVLGGMANILRVRDHIEEDEEIGPYHFPKGTVAWPTDPEEAQRDGIDLKLLSPTAVVPPNQG